jgi:thioesterase III
MNANVYSYPAYIKEVYLDVFGHMNNTVYLTLFEEARWDLLTKNGYGLQKILEIGFGPTILEIKLNFLKELRIREEIVIETQMLSYEKKIGKLMQKMIRGGEVCCTAELVMGLFSIKERKLVVPTPEFLKGIGMGM